MYIELSEEEIKANSSMDKCEEKEQIYSMDTKYSK